MSGVKTTAILPYQPYNIPLCMSLALVLDVVVRDGSVTVIQSGGSRDFVLCAPGELPAMPHSLSLEHPRHWL